MSTRSRFAKLFLRGSLLLIGMLTLWWLVLRTPMLAMLRISEDATLRLMGANPGDPISVEPSGDWTFRVPVAPPASVGRSDAASIGSIEFSISRSDLVLFTFSLPVYCAIALIAPLSRSSWRALLWGAGIVMIIQVFSLLGFIEITAHSVLAQMEHAAPGEGKWLGGFGNYLLTQVIPFAAPVVVAVISHRDLYSKVFPRDLPEATERSSGLEAGSHRTDKRRRQRDQRSPSRS